MTHAAGFTLIEIAIVLLIVALLALVGLPFTRDWVDGNRQWQLVGQLNEGIGQARAMALRNPNGLVDTGEPTAASRLTYDATTHTLDVLLRQADGSWPAADAAASWQSAAVAGSPVLELGGEDFACLDYDTRGRPLTSATCPLPAGTPTIVISVGMGQREPVDVEAW